MTKLKWTSVRDAIDADIRSGRLEPEQRLPAEPELCAQYGASRYAVRRAISALAIEGKLRVQQGSGTYVESPELIKYTIGQRTRFRQSLREQGLAPGGTMLGSSEIPADETIARALGIRAGEPVIASERLTTADSVPIGYGTIFHPCRLFPEFIVRRAQYESLTETYKSYGIADYVRADTTVHTRRARPAEARALAQHPEVPVMIVRAVDALLDGTPISFSQVAWAGARVRFSLESQPLDVSSTAVQEQGDVHSRD